MKFLLLMSFFFLVSCGTLKEMMNKGAAHQKMADRLDTNTYDMNLPTLKDKIVASFKGDHESPTIILPMPMSPDGKSMEKQHEAKEALEEAIDDEGFAYKTTLYKNEIDVDMMSMFKNREKEMEKIKANLKTGPYHVVEDNKEYFMIVKGLLVYKGESAGKDKTKLTVVELKDLKRDPKQLKVNWLKSFEGHGLWFNLGDGPISLEKSMKTAKRDKLTELSMLHYLDAPKFTAWEKESL